MSLIWRSASPRGAPSPPGFVVVFRLAVIDNHHCFCWMTFGAFEKLFSHTAAILHRMQLEQRLGLRAGYNPLVCMKLKQMPDERMTRPRPDYKIPPVVEVILGVQFDRLPVLKNAHLGAFWKSLGQDWPTVSDAPPLQPQFERFVETARWIKAAAHLMITSDQTTRIRIKNQKSDQMIQVQNGRLHFNWLGEGGGKYPRYKNVCEGFTWTLQQFMEFVCRENLGAFKPNQWEVTYLNHILQGTVWNNPQNWGFFRPLSGMPNVEGIIQGESFEGEWHFAIPEKRGRLHVNWQHAAKSEPEAKELIVLNLTARGPLENVESDVVRSIVEGLNLGRDTIVHSFKNLMSDEANKYWGLHHAGD